MKVNERSVFLGSPLAAHYAMLTRHACTSIVHAVLSCSLYTNNRKGLTLYVLRTLLN